MFKALGLRMTEFQVLRATVHKFVQPSELEDLTHHIWYNIYDNPSNFEVTPHAEELFAAIESPTWKWSDTVIMQGMNYNTPKPMAASLKALGFQHYRDLGKSKRMHRKAQPSPVMKMIIDTPQNPMDQVEEDASKLPAYKSSLREMRTDFDEFNYLHVSRSHLSPPFENLTAWAQGLPTVYFPSKWNIDELWISLQASTALQALDPQKVHFIESIDLSQLFVDIDPRLHGLSWTKIPSMKNVQTITDLLLVPT